MTKTSITSITSMAKNAQDYRITPATFFKRINPDWEAADFLRIVSAQIASGIISGGARLCISWPPRHGKSTLATIATPLWALNMFPYFQILLTSYGEQLSTDFGRVIRDFIKKNEQYFDFRLNKDLQRASHFATTAGGSLIALGLAGSMTGRGADVLIVDDYLKSMEEAHSETVRESVWTWFTGTALQRLEPNGSVIIIATRWHEDDLIGRLKKYQPDIWNFISLSAICENNKETKELHWIDKKIKREVGQALFPQRYPLKELKQQRNAMGDMFFSAIYQQNPKSSNDRITNVNWLKIINNLSEVPMNILEFARIWDFGGGNKKGNDYTVGTLIGIDKQTLSCYILDVYRAKLSPGDIEAKLMELSEKDGPNTKIIIEQEPGAGSKQLIAILQKYQLEHRTVESSTATQNKVIRAQPFLAAAQAGKVHLLQAEWNQNFKHEFSEFPEGRHDDQIDTVAMGYNTILNRKPGVLVPGRKVNSNFNAVADSDSDSNFNSNFNKPNKRCIPVKGVIWGRNGIANNRDMASAFARVSGAERARFIAERLYSSQRNQRNQQNSFNQLINRK